MASEPTPSRIDPAAADAAKKEIADVHAHMNGNMRKTLDDLQIELSDWQGQAGKAFKANLDQLELRTNKVFEKLAEINNNIDIALKVQLEQDSAANDAIGRGPGADVPASAPSESAPGGGKIGNTLSPQ